MQFYLCLHSSWFSHTRSQLPQQLLTKCTKIRGRTTNCDLVQLPGYPQADKNSGFTQFHNPAVYSRGGSGHTGSMKKLWICILSLALLCGPGTAFSPSAAGATSQSLSSSSPKNHLCGGSLAGQSQRGNITAMPPTTLRASSDFLYWPGGKPSKVPRLFDPPAQKWLAGHRGIDLDLPSGAPIFAATQATVRYADELVDRPVISLEDAQGRRYTYEPVIPVVSQGDRVERGELIGFLAEGHGKSGTALHFGVKDGADGYLNPLELLGGRIRLWPLRQ